MQHISIRFTLASLAVAALLVWLGDNPSQAGRAVQAGKEGVDKRNFRVKHELTVNVPKGAKHVQIWFTIPQECAEQKTSDFKLDAPLPWRRVKDSQNNEYAFLEVREPKTDKIQIVTTFDLARSEVKTNLDPQKSRPLNEAELRQYAAHLEANKHVAINDDIRKLAKKIVGAEKNPVIAARKIYDWVLDNVEYWVKDPTRLKASPQGSTEYCLNTGTGNCTDFHSLYASLARAAGIPTQIVYGVLFKPELDGQDIDQSYHCWIEFYAPNIGWVPLDVAIADIFAGKFTFDDKNRTLVTRTTATGYSGPDPKLVNYYFGNLEARRVTFSRGRDLQMQPAQAGGPVNAMSRAHIEIDGKEAPTSSWTRKLTFKEVR